MPGSVRAWSHQTNWLLTEIFFFQSLKVSPIKLRLMFSMKSSQQFVFLPPSCCLQMFSSCCLQLSVELCNRNGFFLCYLQLSVLEQNHDASTYLYVFLTLFRAKDNWRFPTHHSP